MPDIEVRIVEADLYAGACYLRTLAFNLVLEDGLDLASEHRIHVVTHNDIPELLPLTELLHARVLPRDNFHVEDRIRMVDLVLIEIEQD